MWLKKEKEQRKKKQREGDNEVERLARRRFKLSTGPRLHVEGIVVPRSLTT